MRTILLAGMLLAATILSFPTASAYSCQFEDLPDGDEVRKCAADAAMAVGNLVNLLLSQVEPVIKLAQDLVDCVNHGENCP